MMCFTETQLERKRQAQEQLINLSSIQAVNCKTKSQSITRAQAYLSKTLSVKQRSLRKYSVTKKQWPVWRSKCSGESNNFNYFFIRNFGCQTQNCRASTECMHQKSKLQKKLPSILLLTSSSLCLFFLGERLSISLIYFSPLKLPLLIFHSFRHTTIISTALNSLIGRRKLYQHNYWCHLKFSIQSEKKTQLQKTILMR